MSTAIERLRSSWGPGAYRRGTSTFSAAVRAEKILNCWNTKPKSSPRMRARRPSPRRVVSTPSSSYVPEVGASRRPMMLSIVDLPVPERPTMETCSPSATSRLTPRRMCKSSPSGRVTVRVTSRRHTRLIGCPPSRPGPRPCRSPCRRKGRSVRPGCPCSRSG